MKKFDVAGLKIDGLTKTELIDELKKRILQPSAFAKATSDKSADDPLLNKNNVGQTWVTTVYSEFLYWALKDPGVMEMLNKADIALPDGIGIFWAYKFLNIPLTAKSYFGKILQSFWQVKYSLFLTLINPKYCSVPIHRPTSQSPINGHATQTAQRIPGSELVWNIAKLAAENNLSIYLLGGFGNTAELTEQKLISQFPNLKISGFSNKNPNDESTIDNINKSNADILFVAYGPIKQEQWILEHRDKLPSVKLLIGLGGTFDYIAGKRLSPPSFIRKVGLEWLFRLITQPQRIRRIWNATFGLIVMLMRYKVFNTYPLRNNCAAVIINKENKIFVGRRNKSRVDIITTNDPEKWKNYWQFPQGGIEENENIELAIIREIKEETGMVSLKFLKLSEHTNTYIWNNSLRHLLNKNRKYRYKGQSQKVAYLLFEGSENEIKFRKGEEFVECKWVNLNELDKIVHTERLPLVKIAKDDLKELQEKAII